MEAARCRRQDDRAEDSPAAARRGGGRTCTGSTVAKRVMLSCEVLVAGLLARREAVLCLLCEACC